jgi:hypothetical protein
MQTNIHDVKNISIIEAEDLATGSWVKSIIVKTFHGDFTFALFADSKEELEVKNCKDFKGYLANYYA